MTWIIISLISSLSPTQAFSYGLFVDSYCYNHAELAIAMISVESSWQIGAINRNNNNKSHDSGLFQINSIHGFGPMTPEQNIMIGCALLARANYDPGKYHTRRKISGQLYRTKVYQRMELIKNKLKGNKK